MLTPRPRLYRDITFPVHPCNYRILNRPATRTLLLLLTEEKVVMSQREGELEFSRQDLRKATKFVEGDYSGINPRSFYRKLKRTIEEIQDPEGFKYDTEGDQKRDLKITSEEVGQKTGTVEGRLKAKSNWLEIGHGVLDYRPYGPHGAAGIVIGIACLLIGISGAGVELTVLGVLFGGIGAYAYLQKEKGEFPVIRQDMIRVLVTGEVSERTTEGEDETRTDIFANMSVVFAGDVGVAVNKGQLEELDWTFRRELIKQVKKWHNQVVDTEQEELSVEDGFIWQLQGITDTSSRDHMKELAEAQKRFVGNAKFEYRLAYANLLEDQLTPEMQDQLKTHEVELMEELEHLAENVDLFVEREGYQHTNRMEGPSSLESGETEF